MTVFQDFLHDPGARAMSICHCDAPAKSKSVGIDGKPVAFYSDKASAFRSTPESVEAGRGVTQFGRVLYELNIDS